MSRLALGLGLALLASLSLNGGYLAQHAGSARTAAVTLRRPLASLRGLLGSRVWLAGGALGTLGWLLHVAALTRAPLSLVQAFLAGGLAVVAVISAVVLRNRLSRGETAGVALMIAALIALAIGLDGVGSQHEFRTAALSAYLAAAGGATALLALVSGGRRAQALGLAGGVAYGAADVTIKALTGIAADHDIVRALTSGWLVAGVVLSVVAFFAFQRGLQTGRALPVIALVTAGTNVVSILGGFLVFHDPLGRTGTLSALHVGGFVLVGVAAWLLAPAQAAISGADRGGAAPAAR